VKFLLLLILIILGVGFFIPDLLSTKKGNEILSNLIHKNTNVFIQSFKIKWGDEQELNNIYYQDKTTKILIKKITYKKRVWTIQDFSLISGDDYIHGNNFTLAMGEEKCNIPFFSWNLKNIEVPKMTLSLGKLEWKNLNTLKDLFSLLQLKFNFNKTSEIWFQDMPLSLKNGELNIARTDFLVDRTYQFAVWNKINLINQRLHLRVGIPKNTIETVIGVKNLPKNYTITLRLDGTIDNPKLHKSDAVKIISAIFVLKNFPLSPVPKLSEAPEAREPFPWQIESQSQTETRRKNPFPW
jgi:hypothetical protein